MRIDRAFETGYRPDIDGLRAIAVLLVVAYHAKVPGIVSGFLGVDIFFVISGYVISRLLLREMRESGTLGFVQFWLRRVVRLGPAFLLVVLTVLSAAPFVLERLSGEIGPLARAALAALGLNANHFFLSESADYFAAASETNPLLHMWSLSVEEQFYLLWPALLLLGWQAQRRPRLLLAVVMFAAISLALAVWLASANPAAAFYLLPARAWQLLVGASLAVAETRTKTAADGEISDTGRASWQPWLGASLISASVILDGNVHRSWLPMLSAVAVFGTAILIYSGANSRSHVVLRVLAHPAVVYLGRVSYPVYLWHWPLLVMTRSTRLYEPAASQDAVCVLAAFALGALTYEYVEKPVQRMVIGTSNRRVFVTAALLVFSLAIGAVLLGAWARFGWGYTPWQTQLDKARRDMAQVGCIFKDGYPPPEWEAQCFPERQRAAVLLWGDSHAQHWSPAIKALSDQANVTFASFSLGGCRPLPRHHGDTRCSAFYQQVAARLLRWKANHYLRGVILSARWAEGTGAVPLSAADQAIALAAGYDEMGAKNEVEALVLFESSLRQQLETLRDLDVRVWLFLPSPAQKFPAPHCLAMRPALTCYTSVAENESYTGNVKRVMRRVAAEFDNVRLFDPHTLLCGAGKCPAMIGDTIVYTDDDHLSQSWVKTATPALRDGFVWLVGGTIR